MPALFALLAVAAIVFYGGRALLRRRAGRIPWLDAHPRVTMGAALAAIIALLALGVAAFAAILTNS
jgi:hypothetical protein